MTETTDYLITQDVTEKDNYLQTQDATEIKKYLHVQTHDLIETTKYQQTHDSTETEYYLQKQDSIKTAIQTEATYTSIDTSKRKLPMDKKVFPFSQIGDSVVQWLMQILPMQAAWV